MIESRNMTIETFADTIQLEQSAPGCFSGSLTLPVQLGVFEGHFPGNPVLPGVAFVFIAEKLVSRSWGKPFKLKELRKTKFFRPAKPLDVLQIQAETVPDSDDETLLKAQVLFSDEQMQRVCLVKMTMEL